MYIVGFNAKGVAQQPITVNPDTSLMDARNIMMKYNISRVVVAEGTTPLGIITEKDMARFLYSEVPSRRLNEIAVSEVMTRDLVTVAEDSELIQCAKVMLEKGVSSLLVHGGGKNLRGIFTKSDLIRAYVEYMSGEHLVRDFMTKKVHT